MTHRNHSTHSRAQDKPSRGAASSSPSSSSAKSGKPAKPHPDFPLFSHRNGQWAKKIRGRLHYFGPWDDPESALAAYLDQKDDLLAGREPEARREGLRVGDLVREYLDAQFVRVRAGEIGRRHYGDMRRTTDRVLAVFGARRLVEGLRPADFTELRRQIAATRGATATGTEMTRIRVLFNWAYQSGLVEVPIRYGPEFRRPSKRLLRLEQEGKTKLFESEEILALLGAAEAVLRPMILLGINAGLGNADVGRLRFDHLDLESGWVVFPRPKTGIRRKCPLWPETVEAIRAWLSQRPEAESPETRELVFLTRRRQGWHKEGRMEDPLSLRFRKLTQAADCYRRRRGFYALRHTFETIAGGAKDQVAVDAIMGHVDATMAGHYRHGISSRRLIDVVDYVHDWLYRARRVLPDRRTGEEIERER